MSTSIFANWAATGPEEKKAVIWYLLFVFFSNTGFIMTFLSAYLGFVGFDIGTISMFFLIYQGIKFVIEIPTGYLSDKYGRKTVGMIGLALSALSFCLLFFAPNPLAIGMNFLLYGLGYAFITGTFEALYVDSVDHDHLIWYSAIEGAVFYLAYAVSALVGGLFSSMQAYTLGICLDLGAMLIAMVTCMGFHEKHSVVHARKEGTSLGELRRVLCGKPILWCMLGMPFVQAFAFVGIEDFYSLMLNEHGVNGIWIGCSITLWMVLTALVGLAAPKLLTWVPQNALFVLSLTGKLILMCIFLLPVLPPVFAPIPYILSSCVGALGGPVVYALFQKEMPSRYRATLISIRSQAISTGAILFFGLSKLLSGILGIREILIIAFIITTVLTALFAVPVYRKLSSA